MSSSRGAWLLAAVYVLVGAASLGDDRFLNDEGLLTALYADLLARDFWPAFFLQKIRPPLALGYAPLASIGVDWFLWAHLLVGALAVPLVEATARRLGHAQPLVAAMVVALSPMFVAAGAAGLSNGDAVVGLALVLLLWVSGRELAAGFVLGVLVWVRAELLVLVIAMLIWAAVHRRPRAVLGLAIWPALYGLAGALYHQYLPWMLHYPPGLSEPMPDTPYWEPHHRATSLPALVDAAIAISPAVVLAALVRLRTCTSLERWWGAAACILAGALVLLPHWQLFNFDQSPRYLLPVLPFVALAAGRAAERWGQADARDAGLAVAMAVLGTWVHRSGGSSALSWSALAVALVLALAGSGRVRGAMLGLGVLLALAPRHFADGARIDRRTQAAHLEEMLARIEELAADGSRPIVTNEPILAAFLARSGGQPRAEVYYLVQADQVHELDRLTNPANAQRERIYAALAQGMYGRPIFPDASSPDALPEGALLLLTHDARLPLVMPDETWAGRLSSVNRSARITVAEVRPKEERR